MKFTGKERDKFGDGTATGLDYFGFRYMSAAQGRFTSPDKPFVDQHLADPQSWNLYSYARNNPLKFVDDGGEAVIYADRRLETISEARRQESSSYNTWLQGFEGEGRPLSSARMLSALLTDPVTVRNMSQRGFRRSAPSEVHAATFSSELSLSEIGSAPIWRECQQKLMQGCEGLRCSSPNRGGKTIRGHAGWIDGVARRTDPPLLI